VSAAVLTCVTSATISVLLNTAAGITSTVGVLKYSKDLLKDNVRVLYKQPTCGFYGKI
jgi:hypothetical protein